MAAPVTEKFEQMTLEISEDGTTWTKICGLVGITINRSATYDTTEVPEDCEDESLPLKTERALRTIDVTVSADGVFAAQSHATLSDWLYSGDAKNIRLGHDAVLVGDPQYEQGPAYLTSFSNVRTKGQKVTAAIEMAFDGTPTRTAKVA